MKKVTQDLYEKGDHVIVTAGYNKGKIGIVENHRSPSSDVIYKLAGKEYDDEDEDYDEEDDDYYGEYETSPTKFLKFITKTEYEKTLKDLKIIIVPGLPVSIQYRNKNFIIGDNVVTPANAKKLADFITEHSKTTKKKK